MDKKTQFLFKLIFGVIIITGVLFLSLKYLLKGPPFIKVMALGLIAGTSYLVIDYLIKNAKEK
jgi:hypothetical protein